MVVVASASGFMMASYALTAQSLHIVYMTRRELRALDKQHFDSEQEKCHSQ